MSPQDFSTLTWTFHAATLIPLGVAVQKFGDRTETFQKSLAGTSEALTRLRRALAAELERDVEALVSQSMTRQTMVLDINGDAFTQSAPNVAASEAYRNCIHEFAVRQESSLAAYHALTTARDGWTRWARRISWSVILFFVWELLAFGLVGGATRLIDTTIPKALLLTSFAPTVLLACLLIAALVMTLRQHDRILDIRRTHDSI
jgi:hypothetical protein